MTIRCVWEHHGDDSLLYAVDLIGAYTRGESREAALQKMPAEAAAYLAWQGEALPVSFEPVIVQEKASTLTVSDADSDVLFEAEKPPLTLAEYQRQKALALRSAQDFETLCKAIPDPDKSCLPHRQSFYGPVPRTAAEMYAHTKGVNDYYFGEIGVKTDHEGSILACRQRGFALLEAQPEFLANRVFLGSYDEEWTLRKLLRRFVWHDRIHARAMWRMAGITFGGGLPDPFHFG